MQIHEAAKIFPMMVGSEFQELVSSIKANGLLKPIELYGGEIIDGRNRFQACQEAGVSPRFIDLPATINPFEYVWAVNAERRHLTQGQKVTIYILQQQKSTAWQEERARRHEEANRARSEAAQKRPRSEVGTFKASDVSRDTRLENANWQRTQVAQATGASTATAARAQTLVSKRPDLAEKVAAGETTLTTALRVTKEEEQQVLDPPKVAKPKSQKPIKPLSDAEDFAIVAISQLSRIRDDDPNWRKAIDRVQKWIDEYKQRREQ